MQSYMSALQSGAVRNLVMSMPQMPTAPSLAGGSGQTHNFFGNLRGDNTIAGLGQAQSPEQVFGQGNAAGMGGNANPDLGAQIFGQGQNSPDNPQGMGGANSTQDQSTMDKLRQSNVKADIGTGGARLGGGFNG